MCEPPAADAPARALVPGHGVRALPALADPVPPAARSSPALAWQRPRAEPAGHARAVARVPGPLRREAPDERGVPLAARQRRAPCPHPSARPARLASAPLRQCLLEFVRQAYPPLADGPAPTATPGASPGGSESGRRADRPRLSFLNCKFTACVHARRWRDHPLPYSTLLPLPAPPCAARGPVPPHSLSQATAFAIESECPQLTLLKNSGILA